MIAQGYDDNRIFGTLNQPYTTRMWRIGRIGARESMYVSSYCSCDAQIQATNLLRTAISLVINCPYQKQEDDANTRDH